MRELIERLGDLFVPSVGPRTSTDEIIQQIVDAVRGGARGFKLGNLTAKRSGNIWSVKYGSKAGKMGGSIMAIPPLVKIWLGKIDWEDIWGEE